jgi:hypothetical protein
LAMNNAEGSACGILRKDFPCWWPSSSSAAVWPPWNPPSARSQPLAGNYQCLPLDIPMTWVNMKNLTGLANFGLENVGADKAVTAVGPARRLVITRAL